MAGFDTHLLLLTMEECGELIQACSKLYRHDFKEKVRKELSKEIADVEVMINLLKEIDQHNLNVDVERLINLI